MTEHDQVVVYTMGKVGSRAIDLAFMRARFPSYHIHTLDPEKISWHMRRAMDNNRLPPAHIGTSIYLKSRNLNKPLYVSCVRDPMARNLSGFFQNITDFIPDPLAANPQQVFDAFERRYRHTDSLDWFAREWAPFLSIDVMAEGEATAPGVVEGQGFVIFLPEATDTIKSETLSRLTGTTIKVIPANVGEAKAYGDLYRKVKELATFSESLLDQVYGSDFVKRFWTPDEINSMRLSWGTSVSA